MLRSPRHFAFVALVGLLAVAACDDGPAPEAGFVRVSLVSPAGAEGGAVFRVATSEVGRVEAGPGSAFVEHGEGETHVVLVREPAGALSFLLEVEDVHRPPAVELVEVAGPDDGLRADIEPYRVEVEREG